VPTDTSGQVSLFAQPGKELDLDDQLRADGFLRIAGIDEAGRGPLAGPVVAGIAILRPNLDLVGLNDSKKMTESKRDSIFEELHELRSDQVHFGIGASTAQEIDTIGILPATFQAMARAVKDLTEHCGPDLDDYLLIIDGRDKVPDLCHFQQMPVIKGDGRSKSIAAASVLAKVQRDRDMVAFSNIYPEFGFEQHKGYGTKQHLEALQRHGACPIHRQSFAPVKKAQGKR